MKILVTGSRDWTNKEIVAEALKGWPRDSLIIDGMARGLDSMAHEVAKDLGYTNFARFRAQWEEYRQRGWDYKRAGTDRNRLMFDTTKPDLVLAFPLAHSKGTKDMMEYAESKGCLVIKI